jgi:hypothetical protein
MKYKKESLEKLLLLIDIISKGEGNEWFNEILQDRFQIYNTQKSDNFITAESFIRLQRKIIKTKAIEYYKSIEDLKLQNELIKDFQEMLWFKVLNQIDKQYLFTYYQIENMINHFIIKNKAHDKIKVDSNRHTIKFTDKFEVKSALYFFKDSKPIEIDKISSIWAKLVFWAVETKNESWIKDKSIKYHLDNIINIRNMKSHRNSNGEYGIQLSYIEQIKKGDDSNYSYLLSILYKLKMSIKLCNSKPN